MFNKLRSVVKLQGSEKNITIQMNHAKRIQSIYLVGIILVFSSSIYSQEDWSKLPDYMKARAECVNYWQPYDSGPNTICLFHFDVSDVSLDSSGKNGSLSPIEKIQISKEGYFKECIYLNNNKIFLKLNDSIFEKKSFIIEFWLKVEKLPEDEAYLLYRPNINKKQNGFSLILRSDGSIYWNQRSLELEMEDDVKSAQFYREIKTKQNIIKVGNWYHIAIYVGGSSYIPTGDWISLYVNGKEEAKEYYGWTFSEEKEPTEISIGTGFSGWIDELRIMTGIWRKFYPFPDNSFADPENKRLLEKDTRFIVPEEDILFKASFENTIDPEIAKGNGTPIVGGEISYEPGVKGKAVKLSGMNTLAYEEEGNLDRSCGSIEIWMKPIGWAGDHRPQEFFLTLTDRTDKKTLYWYIVNCGEMSPTSIFGGSGSFGSGSEYVEYPPDTWQHFIMTWSGKESKLYGNGKLIVSNISKEPFDFNNDYEPGKIYLPMSYPILVDEFIIYKKPLTSSEIKNHYLRYLPGTKLEVLEQQSTLGFITYSDFPGVGKIRVSTIFKIPQEQIQKIKVQLKDTSGQIITQEDFPVSSSREEYILEGVPLRLKPGVYKLLVKGFDRVENTIGEISAVYERKDFPWLGNNIGITDKVLKPWTEMKVEKNKVEVVGREYTIGASGFFDQIYDFGDQILAKPMRIEIGLQGKTYTLDQASLKFTEKNPNIVKWESSGIKKLKEYSFKFYINAEMDYDGLTKFTFSYEPLDNKSIEIEKLAIVVPLKSKYAVLFHITTLPAKGFYAFGKSKLALNEITTVFPEEDGVIFSSKSLYPTASHPFLGEGGWKPTKGNFISMLWVGNDERGLEFIADSDRGWVPSDDYSAIEIAKEREVAEFRLNIIPHTYTLSAKKEIVFGLQATPVKPLPPNWRAYSFETNILNCPPYGVLPKLPEDFQKPSFGAFLPDSAGWDEGGVLTYDYDPEGMKKIVSEFHSKGIKVTPHLDTRYINWGFKKDTYKYFEEEWSSCGGSHNLIFTKSKIDWCVYSHKRWKDEFGIDGVYFDTGELLPNYNTISGTAYILDDGQVQPGWCVFGQREYFKRSAHLFGDLGTTNFNWGNGFYGSSISGWELAVVNGEGGYMYVPDQTDYEEGPYPFNFQRILASSKKWGIICFWQPPIKVYDEGFQDIRTKKFLRSFYSHTLQFDVRTCFTSCMLPYSLLEFGIYKPEVKFYGFWENKDFISLKERKDENIKSGFYQLGSNFLLIVSNLNKDERTVEMLLDLKTLRIPVNQKFGIKDTEDREAPWTGEPTHAHFYRWYRGGRAIMEDKDKKIELSEGKEGLMLKFIVPGKDVRVFWIYPE